jgi:hypothetical protein
VNLATATAASRPTAGRRRAAGSTSGAAGLIKRSGVAGEISPPVASPACISSATTPTGHKRMTIAPGARSSIRTGDHQPLGSQHLRQMRLLADAAWLVPSPADTCLRLLAPPVASVRIGKIPRHVPSVAWRALAVYVIMRTHVRVVPRQGIAGRDQSLEINDQRQVAVRGIRDRGPSRRSRTCRPSQLS